jgi:N-acetylglucosaminyl-diphospho-decaprenol L-rhamnosyltransferase
MTSVSLLVINYRSAALALEAIRTARAATRLPLQVVVVDNSVDPAETGVLRGAAEALLAAPRNLGYAAGINAGRPLCGGDVIVVSNPDVRFGEGSIDALIAANAAVAGPALYWDDAYRWMLPPGELHTRREVLDRALASRSRAWARRRDRRRLLARVAFWSLREPVRVRAISGAVMAIRASAFDAVGGFDERFPLYFEENDFLRRVRGVVYVPAARCRHLYNQSAAGSPEAAAKYAESERAYLRKWGGTFAKSLENPDPHPGFADPLPRGEGGAKRRVRAATEEDVRIVTEASPLPDFDTAAGAFGECDVPDDVWTAYRGKALYLHSVEQATGRVVATWARIRA